MDKDLLKKIKAVEKAGYKVKKVVPTTKKTFEVPEHLLKEFMDIIRLKDLKVKDAIAEALEDYINNRK